MHLCALLLLQSLSTHASCRKAMRQDDVLHMLGQYAGAENQNPASRQSALSTLKNLSTEEENLTTIWGVHTVKEALKGAAMGVVKKKVTNARLKICRKFTEEEIERSSIITRVQ